MVQGPPKKKGKAVTSQSRKNKPQKPKTAASRKDKLQRILRDPSKAVKVTSVESVLAAVAQPVHSNLQIVNTDSKK